MTSQSRSSILVCTLSLILTLCTTAAFATTWHLNPDGTGDAPTIQAALDQAVLGDTVELACGTYFEHNLIMTPGVTIRSATGLADCATIDAQQLGRVLICLDATHPVTFEGLTFTGGHLPENTANGGGLWLRNLTAYFTACDFVDNYAGYKGGGIYADHCYIAASHCRFIGNEGEHGGGGGICGVYWEGTLDHCLFESNRGIDGAGIYVRNGSPTVTGCTFLNNDGWFFGGAAFCEIDASPTFMFCTFVGNEAYLGGGIMTAAGSYPSAENCVIAFNIDGAGVHCNEPDSYLDITCSLVFGNEGGGYSGIIDDQTGIAGNLAFDPLFCDLSQGDLTVASNSPCLPEYNTCNLPIGAWGEGCEADVTGVETIPGSIRLLGNHPNPFNPATSITFELAAPTAVSLRVFDAAGRLVRTLASGRSLAAGRHAVTWDGQDDAGRRLGSGVYFVQLSGGGDMQIGRATLVK